MIISPLKIKSSGRALTHEVMVGLDTMHPTGIPVTLDFCLKYAQVFDWCWAAEQMFSDADSDKFLALYDEAETACRAAIDGAWPTGDTSALSDADYIKIDTAYKLAKSNAEDRLSNIAAAEFARIAASYGDK